MEADRLKQAGIGATGANGVEDAAGSSKRHGLSGRQVGGQHPQRDTHLFEPVRLQEPFQEAIHALATEQPQATEAPVPDIAEAHRTAGSGDLLWRRAAGV